MAVGRRKVAEAFSGDQFPLRSVWRDLLKGLLVCFPPCGKPPPVQLIARDPKDALDGTVDRYALRGGESL